MSAQSVYNDLNNAIQGGSIDLWAAANNNNYPDLSGLVPVLGLLGVNSSWVLNGTDLALAPDGISVRMSATGNFNGAVSLPARTSLQYLQQSNEFILIISITGDWTFTGFFPPLPDTFMQNPAVDVGVFWNPSVLNGMVVRYAVFTARTGQDSLQLTGSLLEPNNAFLLQKIPMIGPWPLRLTGTVQLPNATRNYPIVDLYARGNSTVITGAKRPGVDGPDAIALQDPGLRLLIQPLVPPQNDRIAFSTIRLFADFSLGRIRGQISTLILSMDTVWSFNVVFQRDTASLVQGLAELTRLFGVDLPLPMDFPVLSDFRVAEIDIDLQNSAPPKAFPSFTLLNLGMTIKSDKTWKPPLPFITFSNVGVRWVWGLTVVDGENGEKENTYGMSGSVFGTVNFGGGTGAPQLPAPGEPPPMPGEPAIPLDPNLPKAGIAAGPDADGNPISIRTVLFLPDFILSGRMEEGSYIPIGKALGWFFGNSGPSTGTQTMNVIKLQFTADPFGGNYFADAAILFGDPEHPDAQQGWEINLGLLTILLNQLEFDIAYNNGSVSGGISGTFYLDIVDPTDYTLPRLTVSARYPPQNPEAPEGWTISGVLYPGTSISLTKLLYQFIYGKNTQPPTWTPQVSIDLLEASFTSGSPAKSVNPSYTFKGAISVRWTPPIFGNSVIISASARLELEKPSTATTPSGRFICTFSVNKFSVAATLTFGVPEPTYLFKVQFDQLWLEATTSWRGDKDHRHQAIALQLGGITLGDILEYLVNLVAPTLGFRLDPPWDVLKKIDLSRFVLTIDPQDNIVEFVFKADVDLVVAHLDSIGVRYSRKSGEGKVNLILTGKFLGQPYPEDKPLTWDVINDPPPAVPGQGSSLVKLRYIGVGQRVTFIGDTPNTVAESIARLRKEMTPPQSDGDPLPSTMGYSAESQWLIGLDIQLMETLDLGIIFNDPKLYGLSIALGGEKAGSLAGLRFEILYKKITDDIGMFRIEFQVPDAFRTLQLGAVSITLGIIVIEIYTNGNFKIDLGFPYNRNFERSFSLQAAIFIGRGGFYLGVLNGDTSTQVPRISNGNFSPVIELGIGIAAGIGREIRAGVLSGGAFVELEVLFQGVLAWFNPDSSGAAPAKFFRCQAIAALHGKVYGSVDFVLIKVTVTLEAYAQVSLLYESYQPMLIALAVDVNAEASISFLFFSISFSFHVHLDLEFKVGSAQPTPWILSGNGSPARSVQTRLTAGETMVRYRSSRTRYRLRTDPHLRMQALHRAHLESLRRINAAAAARGAAGIAAAAGPAGAAGVAGPAGAGAVDVPGAYTLIWNPSAKVFPDAPRNAHLTLLPSFTIAGVPVNWDGSIPNNAQPNYRTAFTLFADTGMPVNAPTAAACAVRSAAHSAMAPADSGTSLLAADILSQGLLTYAFNAVPREAGQGNNITAAQIASLLEQLNDPQTMATGLTISSLATFFQTNINLWISGDTQPQPPSKSGMTLPLPPFLAWTSPQGGNIDFSGYKMIGPWYEWGISQWLNDYFPVSGPVGSRPATDDPQTYESFTSFFFRDFCRLLMQNGVKEAQKLLGLTTVTVQTVNGTVQNLEQVAATLPNAQVTYLLCSGDTLDSVARSLGATVEELEFLNPGLAQQLQTTAVGTALPILLGIAPEILALDNPDIPFALTQVQLGTVIHQAALNETLQQIATLFQVNNAATLLAYQDPAYPMLSTASNILQKNSTVNLTSQTFTGAPADFVQLRTAAAFFVRYLDLSLTDDTQIPDMAAWYVQAIATINQNLLQTLFPDQSIPTVTELPPGQVLSVPNQFQAAYSQPTNCNPYTTIPGDTLYRIGYALVFQQDLGTSSSGGVPQWPTFQAGVVAAGNQSWTIPAWTGLKVEAGSTIVSLVRRLILNATWTGTDPQHPSQGTWSYNWNNIAAWFGPANVLAPLAAITVPGAMTAQQTGLSFRILSTDYGLEITDAATRLKQVQGLFADQTVLKVKWLPAQDIGILVQGVLQGNAFVSVVNQSSRMLMSGLQLPDLVQENGHTLPNPASPLPLYDLTGQQFNLTLDPSQPAQTALSLSLTSEQPWITLFNSLTVVTGQTLAALEATYPNLLTYNPGLSDSTFHVGMILLTATTTPLVYTYTNAAILSQMPATGLTISPVSSKTPPPVAPSPLPIKGTIARTYGLEHRIELQTPVPLPTPQAQGQQTRTGNPGLWILPGELQSRARQGSTTLYEILSATTGGEAGKEALQLDNSTFGTLIPFQLKKGNDNFTLFNLTGVDTDARGLLLSLSNWIKGQPSADTTQAFLLLSPAPDAANTSGLTVLGSAATSVYLIQSNLSTETVPPAAAMDRPAQENNGPVYFSTLSALGDFLVLLWEGSVVGGTGYYFSPGQELPGSAFDQQGNITLQLLVIAGPQQAIAPNGRSLLPFNNCALIGTQADSTAMSLFVQSAGSTDPSETVALALLPPGNVGFELLINTPSSQTGSYPAPEIQLKTLYSLLNFAIVQTPGSPFVAPSSGMPALPAPSDGSALQPWQKDRQLRKLRAGRKGDLPFILSTAPQPYWKYQQVMPLFRFLVPGTPTACPAVTGLPPSGDDPYQGYGTQTGMPSANFIFGLGDVLGNRTGPNGTGQGNTPITVGYTDNLIGIGDWPSTARYFNVLPPTANDAALETLVACRPSELLPTPSEKGDIHQDRLLQQQQRYAAIYYQYIQPGLRASLVTSLQYIADPNYGNKGIPIGDISSLWQFAAGSYAFATALSGMTPAFPVGTSTLADIISIYGLRYTELAHANAAAVVQKLFGSGLPQVPAYYPNVEHLSVTALLALLPEGWPSPTAVALLTQNSDRPLKTGTALSLPAFPISTGSTSPTPSLKTFATDNHASPASLAMQNGPLPILQMGFTFTIAVSDTETESITVDQLTNSFRQVVTTFAAKGVQTTIEALANLHQDLPGMLAPSQTLTNNLYIVQEGDTLSQNSSGSTAATLAQNNTATPDLFDPGALLYLGVFANVDAATSTLQELADRYACPIELLLSANPTLPIPANSTIALPGTLAWPTQPGTLPAPYTIQQTDTLGGIAGRFSFDNSSPAALQLATGNEAMPGTLVANINLTIPVGGTPYTVNTGAGAPSFSSLLTALQGQAPAATLADIVSAIGSLPGTLDEGALLICPPARLQQGGSFSDIPGLYGTRAVAFAQANAAMQNLIAPNVPIQAPGGKPVLTTRQHETFNSLITFFADNGIQLGIADIVDANPAAPIFAAGAIALLPPADIGFTTTLPQGGPYVSPITPLQVSIRVIRPGGLVDPEFTTPTGTGPVEMAVADFPPPAKGGQNTGGLSFNAFIDAMKLAFPNLRLGTARVGGIAQDLWQVDFGPSSIKWVNLTGATTVGTSKQPRFFALKPLYSHLVSRTVEVAPLNGDGTLGSPKARSFQGIDVELWARRFIQDMDRFLSGPFASAVYGDAGIRAQLTAVLNAKSTLIASVAGGLDTVLNVTDANKPAALASAIAALRQQLGVSLSKAYGSTILIQYDSSVQSAWQQPGSTLPPASLYGNGRLTAQNKAIPGFSLIAARTDVAKAGSFVNFLGTADNPGLRKSIPGDMHYDISHFEFNIATRGLPAGYQSSDWLSFLPVQAGNEKPLALAGTDPGKVDIPIPLRTFPALPAIAGQQANQSFPDGTQDTARLSEWDYSLIYSHEHEAQDYVVITTEFNLHLSVAAIDQLPPRDLFTELASYMNVADPLWTMMQPLTDPHQNQVSANVENAIRTFATLCGNISQYWTTRLPQSAFIRDRNLLLKAAEHDSYSFNARISKANGNLDAYTLGYLNSSPGPAGRWPDVYAKLPSGEYTQLEVRSTTGNIREYAPKGTVIIPLDQWPVLKLVWTQLNTAAVQNARCSMHVRRNQDLIDNTPTNPAFLFTTDEVVGAGIVTPLNNFGERVYINKPGADLTTALNTLFGNLFGANMQGQPITMEVGYGFELVPPVTSDADPTPSPKNDQGLVTYLPIGLYPNMLLSSTTAATINTAVQTWQGDNDPVTIGGEWIFSLKQSSQMTAQPQTLLNINTLAFRLSS